MTSCTNCLCEMPSDKSICPNCGAAIGEFESWSPVPLIDDLLTPTSEPERFIMGNRPDDLTLGFVASWLLLFLWTIGSAFMMSGGVFYRTLIILGLAAFIYFGTRKSRPTFARGFGFGILSLLVIALGACAVCIYSIR